MPGRNTGKWRWTPVVVLDHDGVRYLISAYGDTEWSRNLRASGARRLTRRGRVEPFTAVEVPVEQRPPLVEAYLRAFGNLPTVGRTNRRAAQPGGPSDISHTQRGHAL